MLTQYVGKLKTEQLQAWRLYKSWLNKMVIDDDDFNHQTIASLFVGDTLQEHKTQLCKKYLPDVRPILHPYQTNHTRNSLHHCIHWLLE